MIRDIPLLLQLLFWYTLLQGLPGPRQALNPVTGVFLSNRGLKLPWLDWEDGAQLGAAGLRRGLLGSYVFAHGDAAPADAGRPAAPGLAGGARLAGRRCRCVVWWLGGAPVGDRRGRRCAASTSRAACRVSPEYFALLVGLVTYTAAFIAEIVRAGILAVAQGQWEAAQALGLRPGTVLRQIVLPQALRVIMPPMTSQYLNLTKNSSLAVAIGYQDIVSHREHDAEPDRPGDRGHRHHHGWST